MKKRDYSRLCRLFLSFSPSRALYNVAKGEGCTFGARKNALCKHCVNFYKGESLADVMNPKREEELRQ